MRFIRELAAASAITASVVLPVGGVYADSVQIGGTSGPGSLQSVNTDSASNVVGTNLSDVVVVNSGDQQSASGNVAADANTSVGDIASGTASNNSGASAQVVVVASPRAESEATVPAPTQNGSSATAPSVQSVSGTGSVLGAAIVAGGMGAAQAVLPSVGPLSPVDVSAIRLSWNAPAAPTAEFVRSTRPVSLNLFTAALLLSLSGGIVHAVYLRRKEGDA